MGEKVSQFSDQAIETVQRKKKTSNKLRVPVISEEHNQSARERKRETETQTDTDRVGHKNV